MIVKNVLEYLEYSARRVPERVAYCSDSASVTFAELMNRARAIGSELAGRVKMGQPVAVMMDARDVRCVEVFMGILYAGCFYAPMDIAQPSARLTQILTQLSPAVIVADEKGFAALRKTSVTYPALDAEGLYGAEIQAETLAAIRARSSVYDPVSVMYTSGSTGIPKGAVHNHYAYIRYTEYTNDVYGFDENTVFGNQSPFFYANSIIDIYPPLALGARVYLMPAGALTFPKKLISCLAENHVTELTMTPSSYVAVANSGLLEENCLPDLQYIIMSGEKMPLPQAREWLKAAPEGNLWNFYGSTEMFSVAVWKMPRDYAGEGVIPVGPPFKWVHILFVDESGREVAPGEAGEMLVSDPWMAMGYYRDEARTQASWVMDPLHKGWFERFYRTGDTGRIDANGFLTVLGRGDTQIKHMGYRMELGEVEAALRSMPGFRSGMCQFDKETGLIWCFYTGEAEEKDCVRHLRAALPRYMCPDKFVKLETMPLTATGKLDRVRLREMMK